MIGDKIKYLREDRGLTQKQFAEEIGLNVNTLASYEANLREPRLETIDKLCDYFDVSSDFLLERSPYIKNQIEDNAYMVFRKFSLAFQNLGYYDATGITKVLEDVENELVMILSSEDFYDFSAMREFPSFIEKLLIQLSEILKIYIDMMIENDGEKFCFEFYEDSLSSAKSKHAKTNHEAFSYLSAYHFRKCNFLFDELFNSMVHDIEAHHSSHENATSLKSAKGDEHCGEHHTEDK